MDRRHIAIGLMWIGAIVAVVALYLTQEPELDLDARPADAIVRTLADRSEAPLHRRHPRVVENAQAPRQYRGGRRHTAQSPFVGPASAQLQWRVRTGNDISAQAIVDPAGNIYIGSHDHHLYSLDADGRERWKTDLHGPIYSTAVWLDDRIYVGADSNAFVALDTRDGSVSFRLDTEDDADTAITLGPDRTLVFGAGSDVFKVDSEGEVLWRFRTENKVFSAAAIDDDGTIYIGSQDDYLYALDSTGRMRWRFPTGDDVDCPPMIGDDGTIYVGSDSHHVYALGPDGEARWSIDVGADVRAPFALGRDGSVLVGVFSPQARLIALDPRDGATRWEFPLGTRDTSTSVRGGPIVDLDGNIYFGADDDFIYSLDSRGALRWFLPVQGNVDSEPILLSDGTLIVGSDDHHVYAVAP